MTQARSCTATFASSIVFRDGFESGNTSAWDKTAD